MRTGWRFLFLLLLVCLYTNVSKAQYPILKQESASQNWYQVNTPKFRVIYPEGTDSLAIGLAVKLQSWYKPIATSLEAYPKKLSLVLRGHTTRSNGFVTLAPRRSEFFTMPPQDYNFVGTNQWLDLLAIHEYRHVVQFEKSKTGFNKLLYYGFGEEALAGMSYLAVPQWFWEGDAVAMETALTPSGRGRIPEFSLAFRTNLLEKGAYSYNKQYLGSFKDYVPNHYVLGYYMVTHLRRKYHKNPWDDILEEAFGKPFIPFTFSRALRKETGKNLVRTYQEMMAEVDSLWQDQIDHIEPTPATTISPAQPKIYTHYRYPQATSNGGVLAIKSGLGDISQLVSINAEGEEKTAVVTGFIAESGMLSAEKGLVVWNEFRPDLRWGARTSTEIKLYNLHTGKLRNITGPSRYSAAALSPDTTKIATVYVSQNNQSYLTILDRYSGKELFRFPNPTQSFISMPRWSLNGRYIVALLSTDEGKTIIQADIQEGTIQELLLRSFQNLGSPVQYGDYVLYNAAYTGIDNIYALQLSTKAQFQVTSRKYGAFNPSLSLDGKTLFFNDYRVDGMAIAKMPYLPETWTPLSQVKGKPVKYYKPLVAQEDNVVTDNNVESVDYEVKEYKEINHLFNIHSWGILWTGSTQELAIGVKSQDILSTNVFSAGYAYNPFEDAGYGFAKISYQGWFPVIDLNARIGRRRVEEKFRAEDGTTINEEVEWKEQHIDLGLRLPLNFTHSKYSQNLLLEAKAGLTQVNDYNFRYRKLDQQADGLLKTLDYNFRYSRLLKISKRDIYSRWGQVIEGGYEHTPFGGDYKGSQFFLNVQLYNPGLFKHHSFYVKGGYQHQDIKTNYRFVGHVIYPKGYGYISFEDLYTTSFNYALPLFYPDWSIGPFFYFQRVQAKAFHDRGWGTVPNMAQSYLLSSSGIELSVDFNFMRFLPVLNLGVRYIYLHDQNNFKAELVIGSLGF